MGVDLAKRVIQVHAVNAAGRVLCGRNLPRDKFMLWCIDDIDVATALAVVSEVVAAALRSSKSALGAYFRRLCSRMDLALAP